MQEKHGIPSSYHDGEGYTHMLPAEDDPKATNPQSPKKGTNSLNLIIKHVFINELIS